MSYVRDISLCDFPIGMYAKEAIGEEGMLAIVSRNIFANKDANCRGLAQDLNESLSEARQWMMRPVETWPSRSTVRTSFDELIDRSA